jgi:hypothetical protein
VNGDITAAGAELLTAGMGLRLVPTEPDKRPIKSLAPRGTLDATEDVQIWRQWMALAPDAGLGVVPGERFAVIDDDSGSLRPETYGIAGTYTERTRRGAHLWVQLLDGRRGRKSKFPGGDFITGRGSYVVTSPTEPYAPLDLDAPIIMLPDDSPLLLRQAVAVAPIEIPDLTPADYREAERVIARLLQAPDPKMRADVAALLAGDTSRHGSASEADYGLALLASYWTSEPSVSRRALAVQACSSQMAAR